MFIRSSSVVSAVTALSTLCAGGWQHLSGPAPYSLTIQLPDVQPAPKRAPFWLPKVHAAKPHKARHAPTLADEREAVADTVFMEANTEKGMLAVALVARNRLIKAQRAGKHADWISIVHAPWQFSCYNHGDPNPARLARAKRAPLGSVERTQWAMAQQVSVVVVDHYKAPSNPTAKPALQNALFYHTLKVHPHWEHVFARVALIAGQVFYNDTSPLRAPARQATKLANSEAGRKAPQSTRAVAKPLPAHRAPHALKPALKPTAGHSAKAVPWTKPHKPAERPLLAHGRQLSHTV